MRFTHVDIWFSYFGFNVVVQISLIVVSRVRKLIFAKQNVEQINIHYMYMYIVVYIICILSYTLNVYCRIHYMYIVGKKIDLFVQIGFTTAYVISAYHQ